MDFSQGKHIIKFSASWCNPCKTYAPIFEETVPEFDDVEAHSVDIDEESDLTRMYGIRGVPTTLLIKDGQIVATKVGVANPDELRELVKKFEEQ